MRKYFRYLIVIVLLVSSINLIDFKEESTDKINNDEMVAIKLDDNKTNEPLLKLGKETVYDGLTRDELILRLNNNLYDTMAGTGEYFVDYAIKTGLDPYLAVSIINLETGCKWGCSYLTKYNNNIGGLRSNGSYMSFSTLHEGITYYLDLLYNNYWLAGLTTAELMNSKYAESTTWADKVNAYYNAIISS